jgi:hypothetical protein
MLSTLSRLKALMLIYLTIKKANDKKERRFNLSEVIFKLKKAIEISIYR